MQSKSPNINSYSLLSLERGELMPGENHPGYSIRRRRLCQTLNVLLIVLAFAGCRTTKNGTSEEALNAIKAASKTPLPITTRDKLIIS